MPLYMDVHKNVAGLTASAVAGAHAKDVEVGPTHGVNYTNYWFNEADGTIFCLVQAPSKAAAARVHREAHGLEAHEIIEVREGA